MNDPVYVIAHLKCRLLPEDRQYYFGDPLNSVLQKTKFGEVTGGGALMDADKKILHIDLEIELEDIAPDVLDLIASTLENLGAPKGSYLHDDDNEKLRDFGKNEILSLGLDGVNLPPEVYEQLNSEQILNDLLLTLDGSGVFQGSIIGLTHTEFLFSGTSYTTMLNRIQGLLNASPWAKGAIIEQVA
jgi:hypothetical protein